MLKLHPDSCSGITPMPMQLCATQCLSLRLAMGQGDELVKDVRGFFTTGGASGQSSSDVGTTFTEKLDLLTTEL